MKQTESGKKNSRSSASSNRFVVCVDNSEYPASLEVRKVYLQVIDAAAQQHGLVRVIDESGEDYLYPAALFVPIDVPEAALPAFSLAS